MNQTIVLVFGLVIGKVLIANFTFEFLAHYDAKRRCCC